MTQTKTASRLDRAVDRYEKAIAAIEIAAPDLSVEHVLDVLTARNAVQVALEDKSQPNPGRLIRAVKELDDRLKKQTNYINQVTKLADWQAILNPPQKEWWWLLDPITPKHFRDRFDWLWRFFSLILLTASLCFVADICTRVLTGGPDLAGVFGVIVPTVLTLLASEGALTQTGREGIEYILTSLKVDKSLWDEFICLAAGLLLGSLILFWSSMPWIADHHYIPLGDQAYEAGQLTLAEDNYNRAIKLNAENTKVYYKLGNLHQELRDYNKAIENYKIAWKGNHLKAADEIASLYLKQQNYQQADEWLKLALEPQTILLNNDKPYNSRRDIDILVKFGLLDRKKDGKIRNIVSLGKKQFNALKERATLNDKQFEALRDLAYVYLKKNQYSDSDRWLYLGLAWTKNDNSKQATILAYQGWIQFKQARYSDAETQLRDAISLNHKLASAHCLLAQVSEKQNKQVDAKKSWEQCLKYASQYNQDENTWIGLAIQGLNSKGKAQ